MLSLVLSLMLEYSGMISAHCNFHLLGPRNFHVSASQVEMGFRHVDQASLELLTSSHSPALAFQSADITGLSNHAGPSILYCFCIVDSFGNLLKISAGSANPQTTFFSCYMFQKWGLTLSPRLECSDAIISPCGPDLPVSITFCFNESLGAGGTAYGELKIKVRTVQIAKLRQTIKRIQLLLRIHPQTIQTQQLAPDYFLSGEGGSTMVNELISQKRKRAAKGLQWQKQEEEAG
ncbi:hypothetical protein AAY473_000063 [Plecturocebus cupreus]